MARGTIGTKRHPGREAIGDMTPVIGRRIARIDPGGLDRIDRFEHPRNLRPALDVQQNFAAGPDERQRRMRLADSDRGDDLDTRVDGAEVVRGPAQIGEGRSRTKHDDALAAADDPLGGDARSEEHTSELQSLMRISYAVFCLKK